MKSNHRAAAVIIPASPNGAQSLHRLTAVPLPFQGRHSGCKIFVGRGLAPADRRGRHKCSRSAAHIFHIKKSTHTGALFYYLIPILI